MRKPTVLAIVAVLGLPVTVAPARAEFNLVERSRGSNIEVVQTNTRRIFKHNTALDRIDTDTYAGSGSLLWPSWSPAARYYLLDGSIKRINNNTSDTMTNFATLSPPPGMVAHLVSPCGDRICLVFANGCQSIQIAVINPIGGVVWGPVHPSAHACVRKAISDIWNPAGGLLILRQFSGAHPNPGHTQIVRYNLNGDFVGGRDIGTFNAVAQSIAPNRLDGATVYILDSDFGTNNTNFVKRVVVASGAVVEQAFFGRTDFAPHDLAYFDNTREVVLIANHRFNKEYVLATFGDANLDLRRERVFTY